jgi:diaminohydroxyphosphoribosylaminopyrimidine deaminase/5-amino-6-(5-phosphoribosylamino)uracil reductase
VQAYIAPKIFGGEAAKTPVGGDGFADILECIKVENKTVTRMGDDILIEGEVSRCLQGL